MIAAPDPVRAQSVRVFPDRVGVARAVATGLLELVDRLPRAVIGLATGSSPADAYRELALAAPDGAFERVRAFGLDEYVGLAPTDVRSYRSELLRDFAMPLGLPPERIHTPNPADPGAYETALAQAGGVDLQIVGLGRNGHIAFNEPGSSPDSRTRVVALAAQTRVDNARFFDSLDEVPQLAVTQGIATVLAARRIVLIATGEQKADALRAMLDGPVGPEVPASFLRLHPDLSIMVDESLWHAAGGFSSGGWD